MAKAPSPKKKTPAPKGTTKKKAVAKKSAKKTAKKTTKKTTTKSNANKTQRTELEVQCYLDSVVPERRDDIKQLHEIMSSITKDQGAMWGTDIVGYGAYHYRYASGREGDWFLVGFSSRKQTISLYLMSGFTNREELLEKLGKYKAAKSCLYIKSLDDVHIPTLKKLIRACIKALKEQHA